MEPYQKYLEEINNRRLELLEKKYTIGISRKEEKELKKLEEEVSKVTNELFPLPFEELEKINKQLQKSERKIRKLLKKCNLESK